MYSPSPVATSKVQLNYRTTIIENHRGLVKQKSYNWGYTEEGMPRPVEEAKTEWIDPTSTVWWLKIGRNISSRDFPRRGRSPSPNGATQCRDPVLGKKSLHNFWQQKREDTVTKWKKLPESAASLLKGPCMDLLTDRLDSLALKSTTEAAPWKAPGTYGQKLYGLASGLVLEGQLSPR